MQETDINLEFVKKPYDAIAEQYFSTYLNEVFEKPFDKRILDFFASHLKEGERVLDLGCGASCQQSRYLQTAHSLKLTAVDLSSRAVELINSNFPEIDAVQMDMRFLSFPADQFAGVIAFYSLIHIQRRELATVIEGIAKVLKPGGSLLIAGHCGISDGVVDDNEFGLPFYYRGLVEDEMHSLLEENNFTIETSEIRKPIYSGEFSSDRLYVFCKKRLGK